VSILRGGPARNHCYNNGTLQKLTTNLNISQAQRQNLYNRAALIQHQIKQTKTQACYHQVQDKLEIAVNHAQLLQKPKESHLMYNT
jgi:hypothetical protein